MKSSLLVLGLIFTSIILLSIFVSNSRENFNSPDSILEQIDKLKDSFKTLQQATTNISTKILDTPKGPLPVSEIIMKNIQNINSLNSTYNELLNGPNAYDVKAIKDTMQKSINEFIDRFNYMNKTLELKLPTLEKADINTITICRKQAIQSIPKLKPATESAIETAKIDPVVTAIQSVQDAFIALKEEVINSGIKLINTPKGEISSLKLITENITNLNNLAEKYQTMLQGEAPTDPNFIKKYIQRNLNIFITTYNYIIVTLNLQQHLLQKNLILISDSDDKPEIQSAPEIPGQTFNQLLSLPLAKLNSILESNINKQKASQLSTQYSTHGFEQPPILITRPPAILPFPTPNIGPSPSNYTSTYIFDTLSPKTQLATQTSTI